MSTHPSISLNLASLSRTGLGLDDLEIRQRDRIERHDAHTLSLKAYCLDSVCSHSMALNSEDPVATAIKASVVMKWG